jgi:DNA-binding NarL/FixJ family response regulator
VLVVDDHPILSAGVQALVQSQPDMVLCGYAETGEQALELVRSVCADIVLMDLSMPGMGGIEATRVIVSENPGLRVLVLSWHADADRVRASLAAGASGYVLKDADHQMLLEAIRAVSRGEQRMSPKILQALSS